MRDALRRVLLWFSCAGKSLETGPGYKKEGQPCKDEEETRRTRREGRTSVDKEWMDDGMERRNEETVMLIIVMCRL